MKTAEAIQKVKDAYEWAEKGHVMFGRRYNSFLFSMDKGTQRISIKLDMNDKPPRYDAMEISYRGDNPRTISRKQVSLDDNHKMSVIKLVTALYQKTFNPENVIDEGKEFSFSFIR